MVSISSYFTFSGNCRDAMLFYQECLGGALMMQTIGESPMADKMPDIMKNYILHAELRTTNACIMGSDMVAENGLTRGNSVAIMLHCSSEEELNEFFRKLSGKGTVTHPVENTYYGALLGDLTDKFGNNWILCFNNKNLN